MSRQDPKPPGLLTDSAAAVAASGRSSHQHKDRFTPPVVDVGETSFGFLGENASDGPYNKPPPTSRQTGIPPGSCGVRRVGVYVRLWLRYLPQSDAAAK